MLRDDEPDEDLEEFFEQEVNYLAEIMETPFFYKVNEARIYEQLRKGACAIELTIFEVMKVGTCRAKFEQWRWNLYDEILEFARELSRAGVEEQD